MPVHFNMFVMLWELLNMRDVTEKSLDTFEQVFDCSVDEAQHEFISIDRARQMSYWIGEYNEIPDATVVS